ncbi:integral membrane protein [Candidatus Thiomargarita nelsonii]|uniref:Integral membrane protein n=1 Tax=Candidatus Thiomargarita nelsonii TaxID=1003181 RepID=A0A176RST9_9GAMM|nr:integral membrane protein [Candidatus Thiomargarita nelsonii]
MLYLSLKTIHIISATVLFGTGAGSAYYMLRAHLSGNVQAIAVTTKHVVIADWLFTTTSGIIQPITGIWMAWLVGWPLTQKWILISFGLYFFAGACWLPVVWLQYRLRDMAEEAVANDSPLPPLYYRYMRIWFLLGWPAFISLVIVFFLMVFRPV